MEPWGNGVVPHFARSDVAYPGVVDKDGELSQKIRRVNRPHHGEGFRWPVRWHAGNGPSGFQLACSVSPESQKAYQPATSSRTGPQFQRMLSSVEVIAKSPAARTDSRSTSVRRSWPRLTRRGARAMGPSAGVVTSAAAQSRRHLGVAARRLRRGFRGSAHAQARVCLDNTELI